MKPFTTKTIYAIRITAIIACLSFAGWLAHSLLAPKNWPSLSDSLEVITLELVLQAIFLTIPATFMWLAWRVCYRWNPSTVRCFVGIWLAVFLFWLDMLPHYWIASSDFKTSYAVSSLLAIPLIILGAIAYRFLCRNIFPRVAQPDVLDSYGQPLGHQSRVRSFAALLGWSIWFAGNSIHDLAPLPIRPPSWPEFISVFGPAILGYATFKFIVWYSKPRTQPALPAGGFEVTPVDTTSSPATSLT